ncbi:hypothetical protein, partial [Pseudoalteromonas piscicida]
TFVGGYAKSWTQDQALNLAMAGIGMAVNSIGKEQGAVDTDGHSHGAKKESLQSDDGPDPEPKLTYNTKSKLPIEL